MAEDGESRRSGPPAARGLEGGSRKQVLALLLFLLFSLLPLRHAPSGVLVFSSALPASIVRFACGIERPFSAANSASFTAASCGGPTDEAAETKLQEEEQFVAGYAAVFLFLASVAAVLRSASVGVRLVKCSTDDRERRVVRRRALMGADTSASAHPCGADPTTARTASSRMRCFASEKCFTSSVRSPGAPGITQGVRGRFSELTA